MTAQPRPEPAPPLRPVPQRKVAVYCRVSSPKQEDGYSLDDQERGCRQYAEQRGYVVAVVEREVADSTALSRPRLDALREAGRRGEVDTLIVYVQDL
jgi:DNA invertase Pin-like site-specific DNA recombinase